MWAFLIWDRERRELFVSRDRYGVKPLHWTRIGSEFLFASEIKALLAHPKVSMEPNPRALHDYLLRGSLDHTAETFFEGIHSFPAGHCGTLREGDFRYAPYYHLACSDEFSTTPAEAEESAARVTDLLRSAVELRLQSDVPVGSCLSGAWIPPPSSC